MVSYIKTQWWRVIISFFCILVAIHYLAQPAPDETTLEGVRLASKYMCNAISWLVSGLIWAAMSFVNWHDGCIRELDKRLKKVEEQAITDLDPEGNGNYIARRRCGPDKEVPYPGSEPTLDERIKKSDQDLTYLKAAMDVCGIVPGKSSTVTLTGAQLREFADKIMEDKK
jgi:hypothetical protein